MPFIQVNDLSVHYQQQGDGPELVLIHAFTSSSSVWLFTNILDSLAEDFRVTSYDFRGHGATTVTPAGYTSTEMCNDFLALHHALDLKRAILVGHSFGGVIASQVAVTKPDLVRGVIFSDTYFPGLKHLEPNMGQSEPWQELRKSLAVCNVEIGEQVDFTRLFRELAVMTDQQRATLNEEMGLVGGNWLNGLGKLADTSAGSDTFLESGFTADSITQMACPVLALYDEFSPFHETREYLEANLANVTSKIVPGAKHLAPLQSTEEFIKLVREGALEMARSDCPDA